MQQYNSPYWTLKSTLIFIGSLSIKSITCLQRLKTLKMTTTGCQNISHCRLYSLQPTFPKHTLLLDRHLQCTVGPAILHSFPYCTIQKHANSEVQKPPFTTAFFAAVNCNYDHKAMQLETWRHTKQIKISQSQITNHDLLNPSKKTTVSYQFR